MTTNLSNCCVCGERPRVQGVLCKECKAEIILTEGPAGVKAVEALQEVPNRVTVAVGGPASEPMLAKAIKCESCGKSEVYNPNRKKASYFCDECGKQLCSACAAYCNHKDFNYQAKILCKLCRAEKSLTGQPVEEVEGSLPGQETAEPKREPKPHCGRTTCVGEFCGCECPKCKEAVASGFMDPMFGKMTPDPDPEPPKAAPAPGASDEDLEDEEEIAKWEGGQQ